jgi:hypothetical protein
VAALELAARPIGSIFNPFSSALLYQVWAMFISIRIITDVRHAVLAKTGAPELFGHMIGTLSGDADASASGGSVMQLL